MAHCPDLTRNAPSGSPILSEQARLVPSLQVEQLISKLSKDETGKRQHYRPIYSLHKWWARRPGTLFRAIILLATQPDCATAAAPQSAGRLRCPRAVLRQPRPEPVGHP